MVGQAEHAHADHDSHAGGAPETFVPELFAPLKEIGVQKLTEGVTEFVSEAIAGNVDKVVGVIEELVTGHAGGHAGGAHKGGSHSPKPH
jgi:hypothetical protein